MPKKRKRDDPWFWALVLIGLATVSALVAAYYEGADWAGVILGLFAFVVSLLSLHSSSTWTKVTAEKSLFLEIGDRLGKPEALQEVQMRLQMLPPDALKQLHIVSNAYLYTKGVDQQALLGNPSHVQGMRQEVINLYGSWAQKRFE